MDNQEAPQDQPVTTTEEANMDASIGMINIVEITAEVDARRAATAWDPAPSLVEQTTAPEPYFPADTAAPEPAESAPPEPATLGPKYASRHVGVNQFQIEINGVPTGHSLSPEESATVLRWLLSI